MTTNNAPAARTIRHYQVTDFESLCDTRTTEGTTIEGRVTCLKCLAILATYTN